METKSQYQKRMRTLHKCAGCGKIPKVTHIKDSDGKPAIKIDCSCRGHLNKCVTYCDTMATSKEDCIERYNIFLNELKDTAIKIIVTIAEDGRVSLQRDTFKKDYEKRTKEAIPAIIRMFENLKDEKCFI